MTCALVLMGDALGRGEEIELYPAFGKFTPKWNDNPRHNVNSPRSLKEPEYRVRFLSGKELTQKLRERRNVE